MQIMTNVLHRGTGMAVKGMDQGSSMVPRLPVRPVPTAAAGASRAAGVDLAQDSSSGVAVIVSHHGGVGVDPGTAPAVARGGRLSLPVYSFSIMCAMCVCSSIHIH